MQGNVANIVYASTFPNMTPILPSYWYDDEQKKEKAEIIMKREAEKFRHYKSTARRVIKDFYGGDKEIYKKLLNKLEECRTSDEISVLMENSRRKYMK